MRYEKQYRLVRGSRMAYVDTGGPLHPIVFLHGNITQSYMWRNIIPHVEPLARCIAIDNIGQGDSDKLDDSGPGSYRLVEHQRYVDDLLDQLDLGDDVTLMMHDWGVQLGLTWANKNRDRIKGLAHMQGLMGNLNWDFWNPEVSALMQHFRTDDGEGLVLGQNHFVEKVLPAMVLRDLPSEVWDEYRRPFRNPGEDRRTTLSWPREIPVDGEPADVLAVIEANNRWLAESDIPKLYIHVEPETVMKGHVLEHVRSFPNQTEVRVRGLHYVHEDSPHEIGEALAEWYRSLPGPGPNRPRGQCWTRMARESSHRRGSMDLHHEFDVAASVDDAWSAFLDMPRIAPCMPGAEVTEVIDERNVKGGARVKVGPVNLRFSGSAEMTEIDPVNRSALLKAGGADAKGRGNADADVRFTLNDVAGTSTHVEVSTILNLTGSVAQYGRVSGLIDEIASQLIGEFVSNLEAELGVGADAGAADASAGPTTEKPATAAASSSTSSPPETTPASGLQLFFKALLSMMKKRFSMLQERFRRS